MVLQTLQTLEAYIVQRLLGRVGRLLKMFPAIIATRGNVIIAAILQWNIYYSKRIWYHLTYVPLVKIMKIFIHYLASI